MKEVHAAKFHPMSDNWGLDAIDLSIVWEDGFFNVSIQVGNIVILYW